MRAAAFSQGVLRALSEGNGKQELLDQVRFISGVSGGALTAAYYGVHGQLGFDRYEQTILTANAESYMRNSWFSPVNLLRLIRGGVNDRRHLRRWLHEVVFEGATFKDIYKANDVDIWINASDIHSRTPFPFTPDIFDALCSNLSDYPIADAVAASMAVPLIFTPVVIKSHPSACATPEPPWVRNAILSSSETLKATASAWLSYRETAKPRFVKLVDGGITDNFGLSSILSARLLSQDGLSPFTSQDALRMEHILFVVVDAGRASSEDIISKATGPNGIQLALASTNAAIEVLSRANYDAFARMIKDWRQSVVDYRCDNLAKGQELEGADWNCEELIFEVEKIDFTDVPKPLRHEIELITTSLKLTPSEVTKLVEAGQLATQNSTVVTRFWAN